MNYKGDTKVRVHTLSFPCNLSSNVVIEGTGIQTLSSWKRGTTGFCHEPAPYLMRVRNDTEDKK